MDLKKILDIIVAFNNERDFMNLLDIILTKMRDIARCEAGTLYILRDGRLYFSIMHNEKLNIFSREADITLPPVPLNPGMIENVSAYCAINNTVINIGDVYSNTDFNFQGPKNYDALTGFRTQSMMVFPLHDLRGHVNGVIQLINARDQSGEVIPFDNKLEFAFSSISNIAASALANMQSLTEINELFFSVVRVMSQAVDERTPYNAHHAKQMCEYAGSFIHYLRERFPPGHKYHLDKNREEQIIVAILLHDIGKVVTPLDIMNKQDRLAGRLALIRQKFEIKKLQEQVGFLSGRKSDAEYRAAVRGLEGWIDFTEYVNTVPFLSNMDADKVREMAEIQYIDTKGDSVPVFETYDIECLLIRKGTLTDSERRIMQEHVSVTGRLLDNIKFNRQYQYVPEWAKKHHEFLNGTGYPDHLENGMIPVEVRIITILDIFDALTSNDRPYRKSITYQDALRILRSMAEEGKLDGELVALFAESGAGKSAGL